MNVPDAPCVGHCSLDSQVRWTDGFVAIGGRNAVTCTWAESVRIHLSSDSTAGSRRGCRPAGELPQRDRMQSNATRRVWMLSAAIAVGLAISGSAAAGVPVANGDLNADTFVDGRDIQAFVDAVLSGAPEPEEILAGDFSGDFQLDEADVPGMVRALLRLGACCMPDETCVADLLQDECEMQGGAFLGVASTCGQGGACFSAGLTAYRPQHGSAYFPFAKTAVSDADEEDATQGPGIRINNPGDSDPSAEDDLIEIVVDAQPAGASFVLARSSTALRVWTTRDRQAGTEIEFADGTTQALPITPGMTTLTLWVEWASSQHGTASLDVQLASGDTPLDTLVFHTFRGIVIALGGEGQVPTLPVDGNHGTFLVAAVLYELGYDVHQYDEDVVSSNGTGAAYDEAVNAIMNRGVDTVTIFGYSHGGGSTYDLAERLDVDRTGIGPFDIVYTSYVDSVSNNSDIDVGQELRRPPSTAYHANHYQNGTISDFWLDGGPVTNSNPSPTGLNVETTAWGSGSTHFEVDDFAQVRTYVESTLLAEVVR